MSGLLQQPHHDGSARYVPQQAPTLGERVSVLVRVPATAGVQRVFARTTPDGEPRFTAAEVAASTPQETWWRAEIELRNPVTGYRFLLDGAGGPRWLNALGVFAHDVPDNTDFRLVAYESPPAWIRDAVIYQIFPDRFARSASAADREPPEWAIPCDWDTPVVGRGPETPYQLYGGDLDGIADRLDHLDRLGVNTVYLTPIFPARSNHRYDAATFDRVDPLLGGDAALARLADAVHRRGWRLLGDITSNHTGDGHEWFTRARAAATGATAAAVTGATADAAAAPERGLYYFDDDGDYECWLGVRSLPKLNWGSAELRRRFADGPDSALGRWLRPPYGLDGWRVDVANMTGRRGADAYTHEVAALLRAAVRAARPDGLLVAEHGHDYTGDLDADGWHGTMNYAGFTRPVWSWLRGDELELPDFLGVPGGVPRRDGPATLATMGAFTALVSWRAFTHSWQLLGSHDTARIRTVVGDAARQEVAVGLLCTLPGVPMIFAGDELGLTGDWGEDSRTPMPWHRAERWDERTFGDYRRLVALRRAEPALRHGGLRWAYADADALAFVRESPDGALLVLARRAAGVPVRLVGLPGAGPGAAGRGAADPSAAGPGAAGRGSTASGSGGEWGEWGENVYGGASPLRPGADGAVVLPGDGPTFQVWRC